MSKPKHPHLAPFVLMPAKRGTCEECAVDHDPDQPHNQQSLAYQYHFYGVNGRWPTWTDAMAHCSELVRERWREELIARGQSLGEDEREDTKDGNEDGQKTDEHLR